ncbi:sec-independent protein translocase protein TatB [Mariprofundus micogutta]|uniref:Sec-independent protein translocase protein TatB n=1 Tax=Mariprofundus micogutta TaxID=1921010 RepID=A0A1L8CJX5_9PROT|nr:Sec-independent protein translocase protein TatB [Mariprofundus micogutta]GAV19217.1 sec-independent protein translocase protein TatB [Mariprofundus micogutta]
MPDIGFLELLLIGAIAFLVLGPERMPELFGQIGRVVKKGRGWINDVRRQIDEETQLNSSVADVKNALNDADITDWNKDIMKQHGQTLESDSPDKADKQEQGDK